MSQLPLYTYMPAGHEQKRQQSAIAGLEAQRAALGDLVVDSALEAVRRQLVEMERAPEPSPSLEGERKLVTIMFADVSGYTAMAEKLDPERARDILNECFEELVPIVERYGGTIDKFVGDEIVALFGAPVTHENDAERACAAALEMMKQIAAFNRANNADLGLHFGINTGRVVAGEVGTRLRHDYSVMGHAVNLAARLEDASPRGEIFVGEQTERMAAPFFEFEKITLNVKGASASVTAFRMLGARNTIGPTHGIAGLYSPVVGRERELTALREIFEALDRGRGMVVALTGEAGVGKSRLTAEARKFSGGLRWHQGRSLSHTRGMSYWLMRDFLRNLLGFERTGTSQVEAEKLQKCLEEVIGETGLRFYPFLAHFLNLPLDAAAENTIRELTAEALQRQTIEAVAAFLLARAVTQPLVIVCEDLHWADPSSLRMLDGLLPLTTSAPLLFLLVLRRDDDAANDFLKAAATQLGDRFRRVELAVLSADASERLLQNLLEVEELPEELERLILEKTEGNAFFLEEVLRSLIDAGVIQFNKGRAIFRNEIGKVHVPDTVQGVLASRMDRLPAEEKSTLQTAAVLGRVFDELLLSRIVAENMRGKSLHACLKDLVLREFLRSHGSAS